MVKKLFISNLSFDVNDASLELIFSDHGTVETAIVMKDRETGRSKGFGFVEMSSDEEALAAFNALDGYDFAGQRFKIKRARPRKNHGGKV